MTLGLNDKNKVGIYFYISLCVYIIKNTRSDVSQMPKTMGHTYLKTSFSSHNFIIFYSNLNGAA